MKYLYERLQYFVYSLELTILHVCFSLSFKPFYIHFSLSLFIVFHFVVFLLTVFPFQICIAVNVLSSLSQSIPSNLVTMNEVPTGADDKNRYSDVLPSEL